MTSPGTLELLSLFRRIAPPSFFAEVCERCHFDFREGIYTPAVVVWLMLCQRLHGKRSLSSAVQFFLQGGAANLSNSCKRLRECKVSARASGYCQARQKLPRLVAAEVTDHILQQLRSQMQEGAPGLQRPLCLIDGSTLQLSHEKDLVRAYPPGRNRHGANHWPVLRIVVFHDAQTGMALRPSWGPMYGKQAVSEQSLAEEALDRLPADAVVMADCNFGIFSFAYAVQQSQRPMILRLTKARAQKILGGPLEVGTNARLVWEPSRHDRKAHLQLPPEARVSGRLIVCEHPAHPGEQLYLFTDLELPAEEILQIYKTRWNIETDLRSLKRTVGLHRMSSKSPDMMEKELLMAISAYNLVRAVMCQAAAREGLKPRDLSFSVVQDVVGASLLGLGNAATDPEYRQRLERMLQLAAQAKLPQRAQPRSYPREVWGRGGHFPPRKRKRASTQPRRPKQ